MERSIFTSTRTLSNVTDYYAANAFAIPESHSEPLKLYPLLTQRGMTLVTLTDHNSIDGVLEMLDAGLTGVFISAEMTTTFPEDDSGEPQQDGCESPGLNSVTA